MDSLSQMKTAPRKQPVALTAVAALILSGLLALLAEFIGESAGGDWVLFLQVFTGLALFLFPPVFVTVYFLIPHTLLKKRYLLFSAGTAALVLGWGWIIGTLEPWTDQHWFGAPAQALDPENGILTMGFLFTLTLLLNLSYRWFIQQAYLRQVENDRLNKELDLLRNQINPHFFFNTLNNLYALSLTQSKDTPGVILKLSDMMRYTIYECQEPAVSIENEVKYLENYIALEQIRQHEDRSIVFEKSIQDAQARLAPMVLIVFVENAFKHGVASLSENAWVRIHLESSAAQLRLTIENNFAPQSQSSTAGLGLANVRRRLDLLYPDRHTLTHEAKEGTFTVNLNIQL